MTLCVVLLSNTNKSYTDVCWIVFVVQLELVT